ncbi:RE1, partial [Symbiodinium sp. KB8]
VEEPSKLVTKLPPLAASKGQDAAVVAGDWLAQLEPSMSSLSSSASLWWQSVMSKVRVLYTKWLESTPVQRLQIRQEVLVQRPLLDRYQRVEQRAAMLLLDSLPDDLKNEVISVRAVTVEAMVFLVHCSFQPGGSAEKAYLLQFLTAPDTSNSVDAALTMARKWIRLLRRGKELQVVLPDPSLLCRGLDKLHGAVFTNNKHPSAAFRIASFKLERQPDYKAMAKDVEDYAQLILGELEAALLAQPVMQPPKINKMEEAFNQDTGKGKAKGKGKRPCWGWQDGSGCKYGQSCMFLHESLGPGRCWNCGSSSYLKPQCPYLGQGGVAATAPAGSGSSSANATGPSSSMASSEGGKGAGDDKPPRRPRKKGGGKAKDAVRKAEEGASVETAQATSGVTSASTTAAPTATETARDEFFEEAAKALKSLRLAKATLVRVCAMGHGGFKALVDSGATTSMRTAKEKEICGLPARKVLLAEGEAMFYQLPGGTLLTERKTSPIVAMSDLMEIGCRVSWSSGEGCQITHPTKGDLPTQIINGCPEVDGQLGLDLIQEAEAVKLRRREAEIAVNKLVTACEVKPGVGWDLGAKAVKDLRNGVGVSWAWLRCLFPGAPAWLVSAVPVVASMDGAKVPWNRRERKRWKQASAVGVHLFCGRDRTAWKSTAEAAHVVTVDQAEDIMADDTYAALLDLALSGKVKTVFGGPPCRTFSALRARGPDDGGPRPLRTREGDERWGRGDLSEWETWRVRQDTIMIFRMLFLWLVAAAVAKESGTTTPDFIMEHPEDPKEFMKPSEWAFPEYQDLTSLWVFPEIQFLKSELGWHWWQFDQGPLGHPRKKPTRVLSSTPCPSSLRDVRGPSVVSEEERDHDGGGFRSTSWASWAPQLKHIVKTEVEVSLAGATLDRIMKLDTDFLEHLQRDHIPYRRDCKACLAGSFRGHIHRRIVAPDAWCLSLDAIGPMKQGDDERLKRVKYGLIATLAVPDVLGKILQPAEPEGDDGGGVGPIPDQEIGWDQEEQEADEGDPPTEVERARAAKAESKWEEMVAREKVENVKIVEVPFFVPMGSKAAPEVLAATKEILLQVRRLGLVVKRVHTDCGREFVNKSFRSLCADRGLIRTTTGGDNFRSNGRVEALVGRAKNAVRTMLSASSMASQNWSFAMRHYVARIQWSVVTQLGGRYPRLPPFGTKVFVKKRSWKMLKEDFVEKVVAARILCPSSDVARGFLVKTEDNSYLTTMVAVENVKEVSGEFEVDAAPAPSALPGTSHRIRGKTTMAISKCVHERLCKLDPQWEEHLIQDEELAEAFLDAGDFSPAALEELLNGLWLAELTVPNRRGKPFQDCPRVAAHVVGMFRHGGVVGSTNFVRLRPALTKFLVRAMQVQLPPGTNFTTMAVNFDVPMQCHRDSNNKPGEKAYLMGVGDYVGGGLWCHTEDAEAGRVVWKKFQGHWLPGVVHNVYHTAVAFDPCRLHQPQPWQGRRIAISAYTVNCLDNCSLDNRDLLQALGFPLPPQIQALPEGGGANGRGAEKERSKGPKSLLHKAGALRSMSGGEPFNGGSIPGEPQTLESPQVAGGGSQDLEYVNGGLVPGEEQTLESPQVAGGGSQGVFQCVCKGYEVDPSLCVCRATLDSAGSGPQEFFIGDHQQVSLESVESDGEDAWFHEAWGAYGPPEVAQLKAVASEDESYYQIVGAEAPLEVGWDLFGDYLDGLRLSLVHEEYEERDHLLRRSEEGGEASSSLSQWTASRQEVEEILYKYQAEKVKEETNDEILRKIDGETGEAEAPLHTKTIPNEVVRKELQRWVPSMVAEYEALVRENDAVEPFPEEILEQWRKEGKEFDLVPGKTVHTIKAFTGRLKTRAVICGNFLGQCFTKAQKYAAGADGVLIRLLLREAALRRWRLCVLDVRTAFLLAPLLFQEARPTLVMVPKMFLMGGVCKETVWKVKRALYGMVTSPRSWEVYRNQTMKKMKGSIPEGEITLWPSEVDGSLWYIMVGARRAGAVICYVDDLLIAGEDKAAAEVASMFRRTWKCTEPQWDDISFNGFEVKRTEEGLVLTQDSYTKDLLERYTSLEGYEEVPAPIQLKPEEFALKDGEQASEYVRAAQVMAGEIQWLAGRCRPELIYATNLLSQAISRCPKEAVYRGGHLLRYLKRYPAGGLKYTTCPVVDKEARTSGEGPFLEGYSDASFAPDSERSQQCVLIFAAGGLIAWTSSRQPFVTMSTAESELVAICELVTCLKSVEQLAAEVMLGLAGDSTKVRKIIYSDSQAALSVCRCAAGSWRTRHLRIRGNMVRELLDQEDWASYHIEGRVMTADVGTKALAADRFRLLVDRMQMARTRVSPEVTTSTQLQVAKRLVLLVCMAALVDQAEAAEEERDYVYYSMMAGLLLIILTVYEFLKWGLRQLRGCCRSRVEDQRAEQPARSRSPDGPRLTEPTTTSRRRRPPTPPVPEHHVGDMTTGAYSFITPSGDRDRWEVNYGRGVAIRWHAKPRQHLFVPGHCAGGPAMDRFTGERKTYAKFPSGNVRVVEDNFLTKTKPAQVLADREWKGRTELRLHPDSRTDSSKDRKMR